MLTIVTGVPGAGKTLFTLERIKKEFRSGKEDIPRPIFVNGIPDLDYRFFGAKELENPEMWYECPEHSVIIIDEAQRVFPQRSAGNKVPETCQRFSTHRHKGHDVFITTQDATNIDAFIRRMCGRHYHVGRILNREMATVYEYDHYESNPNGYHEKKAAISTFAWKFPKKLYERYQSATQHTYKSRTPWKIYALPIMAVVSVGLIWYSIDRIKNKTVAVSQVEEMAFAGAAAAGQKGQVDVLKSWQVLSAENYIKLFVPVIPGLLHSAPFYSELFEAKTFPKPSCITYESGQIPGTQDICKCYTQQMTDYPTNESTCRYWVEHGWFDPTLEDRKSGGGGREQALAARPPVSYGSEVSYSRD